MTEARSKRRVLPLFFIVKSFKKPLLIKIHHLRVFDKTGFFSGEEQSCQVEYL